MVNRLHSTNNVSGVHYTDGPKYNKNKPDKTDKPEYLTPTCRLNSRKKKFLAFNGFI